jgi:AraC-like DNA-binding protein
MTIGFYEIASLVGMGLLGLFSIFLFTQKKGNRLANIIFGVFLFSKCLAIINHLIFHLQIKNPHVYFLLSPFGFLFGPTLYFYVRSLTYKDFKFKVSDSVHLVPFVSAWIYFSWLFHFRSTATKLAILKFQAENIPLEEILMSTTLFFLIALYIGGSILILRGYRRNFKDIYSSPNEKNLSWLNLVLYGFVAIWVFDIAGFTLYLFGSTHLSLNTVTMVLVLVFANLVVFMGLKHPEIFTGIEHREKYQRSPLTREKKEQYLRRLLAYMESKKPYLDPSLTILNLSKKLSISSRYLSQVINEILGVNFFDFVNQYRVDEAKRLITDSSVNFRNILDILFDSGFNSKSAFNRVFKRQTGMTPTQFKRLHSN